MKIVNVVRKLAATIELIDSKNTNNYTTTTTTTTNTIKRKREKTFEEIESTESRLYNMLIEEAEEENAIFLNNNPDFIAKLNKKPQFKENKVTNLVDSVTDVFIMFL